MTNNSLRLESAFSKHQAGQTEEARELYEQVLAQGDNAEAYHGLGILELQTGNPQKAVLLIEMAAEFDSKNSQVLANLGNAYAAASQTNEAIDAYQKSLSLNPASPETLGSLGNLLLASDDPKQAIVHYEKALQINAKLAEIWRGLATALLGNGEHERAIIAIRRAEEEQRQAGQPLTPALVMTRGNVLIGAGQADQALPCFQLIVENMPTFAQGHVSLGSTYRLLGDFGKAGELCKKALELEPTSSAAHYALGLVQMDQGELEEAKASFERTLEYDPHHGRAHRLVATHTRHSVDHPHIQRMQNALVSSSEEKKRLSIEQQTHLRFGLGKALEDAERYDDAFIEITKANQLHRQRASYSLDTDKTRIKQTMRIFTQEFIAANTRESTTLPKAPQPIFVVGMPRSGTSLIEQILSSHPDVHGAGELDWLERSSESLVSDAAQATIKESLKEVGDNYLSRLAEVAPASEFVVDKMPSNFLHLGVIRCALPTAVIVHAKRSPMATCWSVYKNYLGAQGHAYSFDQTELGLYYRLYQQLMEHWSNLFGELIHQIDYELLVSDQEAVSRQLLSHCGVAWHEDCMNFHELKRPVQTLSASQVREPIYTQAVDQWQNYTKDLEPMTIALQTDSTFK